ncbi:MAG: hypothetical protein JRJ26_09770 [Deltaproteobacteria bacterium]|nr:hypothetical protein [Deltaproteobacteria bacterium]
MTAIAGEGARKRLYKVRIIREGDPKVRHIEYVWAHSAREAEQLARNLRRRGQEKILKVKAGGLL